jgi:phosphoglycolate phosphatase-like HAD superfamily hydrolase
VRTLVIFDLDGVITSEAGYWETAREGIRQIAPAATIPQDFIYWVKNHAVNHNWDLAFVALSAYQDFDGFREQHEHLTGKELMAACPGYRGEPWIHCHEVCQKLQDQRVPLEVLLDAVPMFEALKDRCTFAVATGRPRAEALAPLESAGILHYFDPNRIVTHNDVVEAERAQPGESLGKPNPFILYRAMRGDFAPENTVFVGDTLSDVQAAERAGVRCIGVLTALPSGPYRQARRRILQEAGCRTLLDSVLDLPGVL